MSFEKVLEELPSVVEQFREENEIKLYTIIKDDIFRLLNKYLPAWGNVRIGPN